MYDNREIDR